MSGELSTPGSFWLKPRDWGDARKDVILRNSPLLSLVLILLVPMFSHEYGVIGSTSGEKFQEENDCKHSLACVLNIEEQIT